MSDATIYVVLGWVILSVSLKTLEMPSAGRYGKFAAWYGVFLVVAAATGTLVREGSTLGVLGYLAGLAVNVVIARTLAGFLWRTFSDIPAGDEGDPLANLFWRRWRKASRK